MSLFKQKSLRIRILWFVIGTIGLVVVFYTLLVGRFFFKGLVQANLLEFRLLAADYERRLLLNKDAELPKELYLDSYLAWSQVPAHIRNYFPEPSKQRTESVMFGGNSDLPDLAFYLLVNHSLDTGGTLFLVKTIDPKAVDSEIFAPIERAQWSVITFSLSILLVVIVLVIWFLRRFNKEVQQLSDWADNLTLDNLPSEPPKFGFLELSHIASRLHGAFDQIKQFLGREQRFLGYASHELRTPIAVIRSNVELINRIAPPDNIKEPLARIQRSASNMQHMTEMLLWLSREETEPLQTKTVDISAIITEQVESHRYLLTGKHVTVNVELPDDPCVVEIATTPFSIVMANIIRNAFQYTHQGEVRIALSGMQVEIDNEDDSTMQGDIDEDDSYSIGLNLCDQICRKLGWDMKLAPTSGGMRVKLNFYKLG